MIRPVLPDRLRLCVPAHPDARPAPPPGAPFQDAQGRGRAGLRAAIGCLERSAAAGVSARGVGVADANRIAATRRSRALRRARQGIGLVAVSMLRRWGCCLLVGLACAAAPAAHAQPGSLEMPPAEDDAPPTEVRPGGASCGTINARAMEATLVIRQHASALSVGIDAESRPQGIVLLAYLDQWAGRLRGLVDLGDFTECLDDGEAETYRRALATATRVANQAREELFRAPRAPQPQQQQRNRRF